MGMQWPSEWEKNRRLIVSTTGIQTLGFSRMLKLFHSLGLTIGFGFKSPGSLANFQAAKEPTGFSRWWLNPGKEISGIAEGILHPG